MQTHKADISKNIRIVRQGDDIPLDLPALLKRYGKLRKLDVGERMLMEKNDGNYIYYLVAGAIKSSLEFTEGDEIIIGLYLGNDIMVAQPMQTHDRKNVATALEPSYVRALPLAKIKELGREYPHLQHQLLQTLSLRINSLQYRMMILRHSAVERVAGFLLELIERNRVLSDGNIHLPLSRYDMGCYLGLTSETVCRVLCQLEQNGVILKHKRIITILDHNALLARRGAYQVHSTHNTQSRGNIRH